MAQTWHLLREFRAWEDERPQMEGGEKMTGSQQMSLLSVRPGCHSLCLGPRASRVRARSLLACVSAMSARSSASSSSC